nr:aromatic ring-hydroxylating dioxygenase subunit alpha [Sphingomonas sp. CDS-1]
MRQSTIEDFEQAVSYEDGRTAVPDGFPALPEISGGRYARQDFYDAEFAAVWRGGWVCVGREEDIAAPGSFQRFDKLGAPIILVRGKDHRLRAFYNSCRHRGAPVVRGECGKASLLRCQYHSWSYGLDGRLIGVPDERDFQNLDKAERGLIEIRCDVWDGLAFVSFAADAPPLADYLGSVVEDMATCGMASMRTLSRRTHIVNCNWKAAIDAFLEIYHVRTIHPETVGAMLSATAAAMGLLPHGHSRLVNRRNLTGVNFGEYGGAPDNAAMPDIFRKNAIAFHIFPNLVMPVDTVGFPLLLFWPRGPHQCEMEAIFIGPDWGEGERPAFWNDYLAVYEQLLEEDLMNLEGIQASLNSEAFTGMMINYQERRIYWFHEEIDRRIGAERLPVDLIVEPKLAPWCERR